MADPGRDVGSNAVSRGYIRRVLGDAIVNRINRVDEFLWSVLHPAELKWNDSETHLVQL